MNHIFLCGGIGHRMWKHLFGLTPANPGFAKVALAPQVHDSVEPRSVGGKFLSPKGMIVSSWKIRGSAANDIVELSVSLPVGVKAQRLWCPSLLNTESRAPLRQSRWVERKFGTATSLSGPFPEYAAREMEWKGLHLKLPMGSLSLSAQHSSIHTVRSAAC